MFSSKSLKRDNYGCGIYFKKRKSVRKVFYLKKMRCKKTQKQHFKNVVSLLKYLVYNSKIDEIGI